MAAALLLELHGDILRSVADLTGVHFEGLSSFARKHSDMLPGKLRRHLRELDSTTSWLRHITSVRAAAFKDEIIDAFRCHSGPAAVSCLPTHPAVPISLFEAIGFPNTDEQVEQAVVENDSLLRMSEELDLLATDVQNEWAIALSCISPDCVPAMKDASAPSDNEKHFELPVGNIHPVGCEEEFNARVDIPDVFATLVFSFLRPQQIAMIDSMLEHSGPSDLEERASARRRMALAVIQSNSNSVHNYANSSRRFSFASHFPTCQTAAATLSEHPAASIEVHEQCLHDELEDAHAPPHVHSFDDHAECDPFPQSDLHAPPHVHSFVDHAEWDSCPPSWPSSDADGPPSPPSDLDGLPL